MQYYQYSADKGDTQSKMVCFVQVVGSACKILLGAFTAVRSHGCYAVTPTHLRSAVEPVVHSFYVHHLWLGDSGRTFACIHVCLSTIQILGRAYMFGTRGVEQNAQMSEMYFNRAIEAGEAAGHGGLGQLYAQGCCTLCTILPVQVTSTTYSKRSLIPVGGPSPDLFGPTLTHAKCSTLPQAAHTDPPGSHGVHVNDFRSQNRLFWMI